MHNQRPSHRWQVFVVSILLLAGLPTLSAALTWPDIEAQAKGQTVDWFMWGGFPSTNAYVNGYVAPRVKERYGITLRQVPVKDIAEVVGKLLAEKQAGKGAGGEVDLMWINGENFRTAKRHGLL